MSYHMKAKGERGEILIYEAIGESWFGGVSAKRLISDLNNLKDVTEIDVRLNSEGGNIFDGIAIYQALIRHPARIVTHVDALAASAASVVAMAGKEIVIASNGWIMIHNPWSIAMGGADDMRKKADLLDGMRDTIVNTYTNRTGREAGELKAWMDEETWFNADDAIKHGFADRQTEDMKMAACISNLEMFKRLPDKVKASAMENAGDPEYDLLMQRMTKARVKSALLRG